jgi:hypothetical protein
LLVSKTGKYEAKQKANEVKRKANEAKRKNNEAKQSEKSRQFLFNLCLMRKILCEAKKACQTDFFSLCFASK